MKITKQARRDAKHLFRTCHVGGVINEDRVRSAVGQVLSLKPRGYAAILAHLQRLIKLDQDRRSARVESSFELSAATRSKVQSSLVARYGQGLNFTFVVNPTLIGGLRVQVGSDVFDGSVLARLNALEGSF